MSALGLWAGLSFMASRSAAASERNIFATVRRLSSESKSGDLGAACRTTAGCLASSFGGGGAAAFLILAACFRSALLTLSFGPISGRIRRRGRPAPGRLPPLGMSILIFLREMF